LKICPTKSVTSSEFFSPSSVPWSLIELSPFSMISFVFSGHSARVSSGWNHISDPCFCKVELFLYSPPLSSLSTRARVPVLLFSFFMLIQAAVAKLHQLFFSTEWKLPLSPFPSPFESSRSPTGLPFNTDMESDDNAPFLPAVLLSSVLL